MKDSFYMLKALLKDTFNLDGIIFYSYEMLPDSKKFRLSIFKKFINAKKKNIFCVRRA